LRIASITTLESPATTNTWTLHHLTDTHTDSHGHAKSALARRIQEIAEDPYALWTGGGDYWSIIMPGDKRFGMGGHLDEESRQYVNSLPYRYVESVVETFKPIADKCVSFGAGNHERSIQERYAHNVAEVAAHELGLIDKYVGYRGFSRVVFEQGTRRVPLTIYQHHGWSGGRLKGRKALQAERELGENDADIYLTGHDHQPYAHIWLTRTLVNNKGGLQLKVRPRVTINGGSWATNDEVLPGYTQQTPFSEFIGDSWSSTKNYRAEPVGSPILRIHVDHGRGAGEGDAGRPSGVSFEIIQRS
jgi:predicted phosphodiesterase